MLNINLILFVIKPYLSPLSNQTMIFIKILRYKKIEGQ